MRFYEMYMIEPNSPGPETSFIGYMFGLQLYSNAEKDGEYTTLVTIKNNDKAVI